MMLDKVIELRKLGYGRDRISRELKITTDEARKYIHQANLLQTNTANITNWREFLTPISGMQALSSALSKTNHKPNITIDTDVPICIVPLADFHIGAYGTDYSLLEKITDELLSTPNLYTILLGDELDLTIKLRSVAEVFSGVLTPEQQVSFARSWMEEVAPKVIAAIAGNHDERTTQVSGISIHKDIFAKFVPWANGIMHIQLKVGDVTYNIAGNHTFRGYSMYNRTHGQKRFSREQYPDGDIYLAGHTHQPAYTWEMEHGKQKLYINTGTLKTNDSYAKTFFTLHSHPDFPCFVLYPREKRIIPLPSVAAWLSLTNQNPTLDERS